MSEMMGTFQETQSMFVLNFLCFVIAVVGIVAHWVGCP